MEGFTWGDLISPVVLVILWKIMDKRVDRIERRIDEHINAENKDDLVKHVVSELAETLRK